MISCRNVNKQLTVAVLSDIGILVHELLQSMLQPITTFSSRSSCKQAAPLPEILTALHPCRTISGPPGSAAQFPPAEPSQDRSCVDAGATRVRPAHSHQLQKAKSILPLF